MRTILIVLTLLFGSSRGAIPRVRRSPPSFWWLGSSSSDDDLTESPIAEALVGFNRPADSINHDVNNDLSGLFSDDVPLHVPCECVPYYQCKDGAIVDDGAGIIDIR